MRCTKFGVAVLQTCMLDWRVSIFHGYMCIVLYMKLIWCNGFAEIYAQLEGAICHRYMCIVLYMYIYIWICHEMCQVWCSGIAGIYAQLGGQFNMDICALYYI